VLPALAALLLSAAGFYASTGLGEAWPLAWVAAAPVLWLAFAGGPRCGGAAAALAFFLGSLNLFAYLAGVIPAGIVLGLLALRAAAFGAAVAWAAWVARRLRPAVAVFAFPAAWTAVEFLVSLGSPHGTALSLGYSVAGVLPVLQVAAFAGLWGLTFLVTIVPAALALAAARRSAAPLGPAVVILGVVLAVGFGRLAAHPDGAAIRVGLAVTDQDIGRVFETTDRQTALAIARGYAQRVEALADGGARVVVLPEKMTGVTPADAADVESVLAGAARTAQVTLVAGINRVGEDPRRNVALVFGPDGRRLVEYDKRHMLPGPESGYRVGDRPGLFDAAGQPWGVAICKDMDFQGWSRQYGRRGIRLLAVPAWDFAVDGRLHFQMALVRSVENGFSMVRAAERGLLTVSDGWGRLLASRSSEAGPGVRLTADVPPGPGPTLYTRAGDWLGWLSALCTVLLAAAARGRPRPGVPV
jgi:apolipoprotein N-acyltransferase